MYIDISDGHIAKSVMLCRIPEHSLNSCSVYAEIPSGTSVDFLIIVLLKNGRKDLGKKFSFCFIVCFSRQHVRLWKAVHDVGMFVQKRIDRPCRADFDACLLRFIGLTTYDRPMPESPPLLILCGFYVDHLLALDILLEISQSLLGLFG